MPQDREQYGCIPALELGDLNVGVSATAALLDITNARGGKPNHTKRSPRGPGGLADCRGELGEKQKAS